ncbi:Leucine-rich repeat protein kinase family protein [Rhynchospora pubera]|uniref:Leucine-rich repeat protein kinase family protein n=1 Tax=Rhynchospora pubera TaxID=906938 RepID=A0AAV8C4C6_9POAL|nr:Leucine-rich repeat protein kinase family protein [Rhynchospora pubera]
MVATSSSTLPPLLNAIELYTVAPLWGPTDAGDVAAINRIKVFYNITKGWSGDPCLPTQFLWTGVDCSTNSNITRITGLDIRGNSKISTVLPPGLQRKQQDGSLKYRFGDISLSPSASAKKNVIIAIAVVVSLLIMATAIGTIFGLKRKKYNQTIVAKPNENYESGPDHARNYVNISQAEIRKGELESKGVSNFENRKFRYKDLKRITNGLKNKIGTGGFGSVYLGLLENEFQVAVKIRSQSSKQGVKEFMAEAENLARVHHKNLVSLVGYCIDNRFMALVYEYMPEGNLHDKIKDNEKPLAWKQRLQIAYESALGLEHLHMACNPPLIHRDVKTSNILLSANLEAKLSDFGLSRIFSSDVSHISTRVVGTPGYVAPE